MSQKIDELLKQLNTDRNSGLDAEFAEKRLGEEGANQFIEDRQQSVWALIWAQVNNSLIYILIGAAVISAIAGEISDAAIIGIVILINTAVGVIQESKAEKALQELKKMSTPTAIVKRDGVIQEIASEHIVRGDIVYLEAGKIVPADVRLLETTNLQMEESSLTGESTAVEKDASWECDGDVPLGDRKNMAFMSTLATYGRGIGVVVRTGMDTEVGNIAKMLHNQEKELTPLQEKLNELGKILGIGAIVISAVIFLIGFLQGREVLDMFLIAVSLAVAAIPEGLPAIVTIVLALGVQRMIKRNAVIRNLPAVETLGAVTVICSDKTGTLTQNKMTLTHCALNGKFQALSSVSPDDPTAMRFLQAIMLCNDATAEEDKQTGDPTEIALIEAGNAFGYDKKQLEKDFPRIDEIPFDSNRKMMTTVHGHGKERYVFVKGALERLLPKLAKVEINGDEKPFTEAEKNSILSQSDAMADEALRVLAVAYKKLPNEDADGPIEENLIFLGLTGMIDPPRGEVKDSIATSQGAGVQVIMITGDHQKTALAIAEDLHIAEHEDETITGQQLNAMTDSELQEKAKVTRVFARVSPEHKVRIVDALKQNGNVVSMTGDGVNDAPSLKKADVGVAMGITGTDVAKGASDVILTDDNFSTITAAIEEGRNIYKNIKKSILFLLSCNLGEIVTLFIGILMGWPAPLMAIHILWINLITDTLPAISLGVDPEDPNVMKEKPRPASERIFVKQDVSFIVWNGILIGILTLFAFMEGLKVYSDAASLFSMDLQNVTQEAVVHAQTFAFLTLSIAQLFHAFNLRSRHQSIFRAGIFKNRFLVGSVVLGILLQVALVYVPFLSDWFHLRPVGWGEWLFIIGLSIIPVIANEIAKAARKKYGNKIEEEAD